MQPTITEPYIELDNVSFAYGVNTPVVDRLSFTIRKGDYMGIIGPNGGGKTTLLKIILGLLRQTEGTVKLFGKDSHDFKDRYRIGYVPQRVAQTDKEFPATVFEVVRSGRIPRLGFFLGFTEKDTQAVNRAMEVSGIARYRDTLIGNLSGGERQRAFIARALASEPDVLILDEPTVGVDIGAQKAFYEFLSSLNLEHNLTIIFVSHDVDMVSRETKTVLCLNRSMVCHGVPHDLLSEHLMEELYGGSAKRVGHTHK